MEAEQQWVHLHLEWREGCVWNKGCKGVIESHNAGLVRGLLQLLSHCRAHGTGAMVATVACIVPHTAQCLHDRQHILVRLRLASLDVDEGWWPTYRSWQNGQGYHLGMRVMQTCLNSSRHTQQAL